MPRPRLTTRVSLWLPPVVYMAVIFYLSSQPDPLPEVTARVWDKVLRPLTAFVAAALLAAAYGATDEYHQLSVPLRNGDLQDWMVDFIGAWLGALVSVLLRPPSTP